MMQGGDSEGYISSKWPPLKCKVPPLIRDNILLWMGISRYAMKFLEDFPYGTQSLMGDVGLGRWRRTIPC
jgi:hypothetical protein